VALVGLVRVSTNKQETARQHDALDPICVKVSEEKVSGKLHAADRPGLTAAIAYLRNGDMLTVQEVDRLGRNLLEGLIVLTELFQRGIAVKVLEGIAAGEHTERSLVLDLALALAEDRRRDISRKTKKRPGRGTSPRPRRRPANRRRRRQAPHDHRPPRRRPESPDHRQGHRSQPRRRTPSHQRTRGPELLRRPRNRLRIAPSELTGRYDGQP
jgi:DNA invertase Pin-like site-specific DNA recombinase